VKQPIDPTGVARRKVERFGERAGEALDAVVVEEPLEIRVDGETIGVTMRTPGDDARLALGFLFAEGIISSLGDVGTVSHCGKPGHDGYGNVIEIRSAPGTRLDADRILEGRRFVPTSSACGVCGRQTVDDLIARCGVVEGGAVLGTELVLGAVERMRGAQARFDATGGLHAAAAFDAAGRIVCCHEDVGRHNAVDKVVGELLRFGLVGAERQEEPPALLVVSGRAGFEIVQKAAVAKIPIVVSVSAATSLAIDLAEKAGLTLVGFARQGSLNVYTHPWRIQGGDGRSRLRAVPGGNTGDEAPSDDAASAGAAGGGEAPRPRRSQLPGVSVEKIRSSGLSREYARRIQQGAQAAGVAVAAAAAAAVEPAERASAVPQHWHELELGDEEVAALQPVAHVVPDAQNGAVVVTARQRAQAQARRRSVAAELVERTNRMIRDERERLRQARAAAALGELQDEPQQAQEPPMPRQQQRTWSSFAPPFAQEAQLEQRAILIDDRDPAAPATIFWPEAGWSTGRVRGG